MFLKVISLVSVLVLVTGQAPPAGQEHPALQSPFVRSACAGNADQNKCAAEAVKCLFRSPVTEGESPLCQCIDKVAGVAPIFKDWVAKENGGIDICTLPPPPPPPAPGSAPPPPPPQATGAPPTKIPVTFQEFLTKSNAKLESDLACCVAQIRELFDANRKIQVKTWQNLASTLEDANAKTAVQNSIAACAATVNTCNSIDVIECVTKGCYATLTKV